MFNAGMANTLLELMEPSDAVDGMGSPEFGWIPRVPPLQLYAYSENDITAVDSMSAGPREEALRTTTFVTRNFPGLNITTRQRAVDVVTGVMWRILSIRYDQKQTTCFIDVQSGASRG